MFENGKGELIMPGIRYEDLYDAAAVVGTEQHLVGRLDPAVIGITCPGGEKRKVTGLMGQSNNAGYLVGRLAGRTMLTFSLEVLLSLREFAPLDIDVPAGQTLAFYEMSTSGTDSCVLTVRYEV
jgi:hypothetical protein